MHVVGDHEAVFGDDRFPCAVGRAGRGAKVAEGDGVTPIGRHAITAVLYRPDRLAPPITAAPLIALKPDDGWCDSPADPRYDQHVRRPFNASHERLWRADGLYDVIGVLDWRPATPVATEAGSAIFLHCAAPDFRATAGCIALTCSDLVATLRRMSTEDYVVVNAS
ncbi:MAG: L,D-transpeptidase family protein [Pseudomonadota bacterium]